MGIEMRRLLLVLAVTKLLTVSVSELTVLQRLPAEELRERFDLPESCDPSLMAVGRRHHSIEVVVQCSTEEAPSGDSVGRSPVEHRRRR